LSGTLAPPTSDCPVCEAENPTTAVSCATCGYPTALAVDAMRGLADVAAMAMPATTSAPRSPRRPARVVGKDPTAEQVERTAVELDGTIRLIGRLGVPTGDVTVELHQAALTQADGRSVEALSLLRSALARLHEATNEALARRLRSLEERQAVLRTDGVAVSLVGAEAVRIRAEIDAGRAEQAIERLVKADEQLGMIETDWKGLKGLLRQIDELRAAAEVIGRPVADVEESVQQIKALLADPDLSTATLDDGAQIAARALMLLHEALPGAIEQELERHAEALDAFPSEHTPARPARAMHAEATRHLRRGKISEATARLRELRVAIRELGDPQDAVAAARGPTPETSEPGDATPPPADTPEIALGRLLQKARGLAARVRSLPADSELAYEAAGEIRRATEQLRARKLEEADATLSRLMRTLDAEVPQEP
jgi:tetratricopeptide (TPR) repeat protein